MSNDQMPTLAESVANLNGLQFSLFPSLFSQFVFLQAPVQLSVSTVMPVMVSPRRGRADTQN
jgi:hypothetical protein